MAQEAKAVRSKGHGKAVRYNRADRGSNFALPRKGADVSLVIDLKYGVRGIKLGGKVRCSALQTELQVMVYRTIKNLRQRLFRASGE